MGLIAERQGTVRFNGEDISRLKPFEIARRGLGFTPEDRRIFSDLTVMENLDVGRQPPRSFRRRHAGAVLDAGTAVRAVSQSRPKCRTGPADRMSGGEQQMLTVARTLMGNPLLVLLDEPSEGVAPLIVEQMANTIIELKKAGPVDPAVRAEHPFRPAGVRPGLRAGKGPDPAGRARSRSWTPMRTCRRPTLPSDGLQDLRFGQKAQKDLSSCAVSSHGSCADAARIGDRDRMRVKN